jgi:two-component system, cell cycle sensor histidine kinase and response regulator CckA
MGPGKNTVLLIDDEAVVREIGKEMLEVLGIPCISAENGETGIRLLKENMQNVGMVILDIEMPGITGEIVYDRLKEINPALPIVVCSGYGRNHLEAIYFRRKLDSSMYMPKPFQLSQLSQKIKYIMTLEVNEFVSS